MNLELRRVRYPYTRENYMGVVNKIGDETAKLATRYTYAELQLFKAVVEAIALGEGVDGEQMIAGREAANIDELKFAMTQAATQAAPSQAAPSQAAPSQAAAASQPAMTQSKRSLSAGEKDKALRALVADAWLGTREEGDRVYYTIGVRTFLELHKYLLDLDLDAALRERWEAAM